MADQVSLFTPAQLPEAPRPPAPGRPRFLGSRVGGYRTIVADCPWPERGSGRIKRGADRHYPLMEVEAICDLPVAGLAHPDGAHCYLWVTNSFLPAGLEVLDAWGFDYRTAITWAKDRIGLGQYFRGQTEHCLFAVRGNLPYKTVDGKRAQGRTLIAAPRGAHSVKPWALQEMAERVSYGPRIELFARRTSPGWDAWGNEMDKAGDPWRIVEEAPAAAAGDGEAAHG